MPSKPETDAKEQFVADLSAALLAMLTARELATSAASIMQTIPKDVLVKHAAAKNAELVTCARTVAEIIDLRVAQAGWYRDLAIARATTAEDNA